MAVKKFKPTSPGRRFQSVLDHSDITQSTPEKRLLRPSTRSSGRNNYGRLTVRRRGGGHKRRYRVVDFKRDKVGVPGEIEAIQYDPNRTARLALVKYADGDRRYILAPWRLPVGAKVAAGPQADIRPGNTLPLSAVPLGSILHNIELRPGGEGSWPEVLGPRPSSWPRKELTVTSSCRRAKCVSSYWPVERLWDRWETWTMRTSPSARQGALAISGEGRRCEVWS